jgi:Outer membrane protein beta-barrel domain
MDSSKYPAGEGGQIDDLFRKTLGDHTVEPSDNLWKGVSRRLLWKEIGRFNFTNVPQGYWISGAAAIALILGLLFYYSGSRSAFKVNPVPEQVSTGNAKSFSNPAPGSSTVPQAKQVVTGGPDASIPVINKPGVTRQTKPIASASPLAPASPVTTTGTRSSRESGVNLLNPSSSRERWSIDLLEPLSVSGLTLAGLDDTILTFNTPQGIMRVPKVKQVIPQSFSADFGVTPEWISYNTTHAYSEMNYWMNAKVAYHFSRFSIQTGIALGYVYDEGKYSTKYISKDSIGYFTSIISFYVNPDNQNEIIFNTKDVAVYDSLQHYSDDRTRNRYTYLEFPLLFGYRLIETNRLSMDIMAGPAVTLLVGTRLAEPYIEYPNARIVRIDDNTPQRVKTTWKIALSLHLEYRVSKHLGCYLEPSYKYYFNSFTEKEQTSARSPYSIGVGLGIRYHFGHIKK